MNNTKKITISSIICFVLLLYVVTYRVFIYPNILNMSEAISASFSVILFGASLFLLGFRKRNNKKWSKSFIKIALASVIVYFISIYLIGIVTGYLNNSYALTPIVMFRNILFPLVMLVCCELVRYIIIKSNKDRIVIVFLITGLLYLFDINFFIKNDSFSSFNKTFEFCTTLCIPVLMKHILCSYFDYYGDYKAPILYRILTELYVFIVPVQPNLSGFITSIVSLVLPFACLLMATKSIEDNIVLKKKGNASINALDIPAFVLIGFLFCVIFGIGPYKLVGIETGSMQPAYKIGDGVIIDKNYDIDELKVGDVISYERNDGKLVIHRIVKINADGSFITQGDYNNAPDTLYVTNEQVRGVVRLKIPYIAYPALFFK